MSRILVTGTSGFIGKELAENLAKKHQVVGISRKDPGISKITNIKGDFALFEDLRQLDKYKFDAVIHLGAVTGGCSERDGMMVNVEGTRCLMRYLIDRGCKKFVMASSIAAVGFQSTKFCPLHLPISDEHPCLDRDGYGLSKYLMEEVTKYYQLQNSGIDVINLRLSAVCPDEKPAEINGVHPLGMWCLGGVTIMLLSDAVKAFTLAAEAPFKSGIRIMNATAPLIYAKAPTSDVLRKWWGNKLDYSYFENPDNKYAGVYDVSLIKKELGFTADKTVKYIKSHQ